MKIRIANAIEKRHFNPDLENGLKKDASRQDLVPALEQQTYEG